MFFFLDRWIPDVILVVSGYAGDYTHTSEIIPASKQCTLPELPRGTKSNCLVTHIDTNGERIVNIIYFKSVISQCFLHLSGDRESQKNAKNLMATASSPGPH